MKKLFIYLLLAIGTTAFSAHAGQRYTVIVSYEYVYTYVDKSTGYTVGQEVRGGDTANYSFYTETKYEAEQKAISQCQGTCSTYGFGEYQGDATYRGKQCKVYMARRIKQARAQ